MSTDRLRISVVIAFYRQARELSLVLTSFLQQTIDRRLYELLVVDDHSPDFSGRETVAKFRREYPDANLFYVRNWRADGGSYGASAKPKNIGVRLARGDIIFFNNAEIVQAGESLQFILSEMDAAGEPLCLRGVILDLPYERIVGLHPAGREELHDGTSRACERTATAEHAGLAATRREDLIRVGGNDERFDYWGKEDLDLAARLKRAGTTYRHDHRLKSFHISHPKNHVKQGDYGRMASLLNENNEAGLVEANRGQSWGTLDDPGPGGIQASVALHVDARQLASGRLAEDVEHLVYGDAAETHQVLFVCDERDRCAVEAWVSRFGPRLPVVSYSNEEPGCIMARLVRRTRGSRLAWLPGRSERAQLDWALRRAQRGGIVPLPASEAGRLGWVAPVDAISWSDDWGHPLSWGERALQADLWDLRWVSTVLHDVAPMERSADTTASHISATASVLAVLRTGRDRRAALRSIRALAAQSRTPDATCVFAPVGVLPVKDIQSRFEGISFYATEPSVHWDFLLRQVIARAPYEMVVVSPPNALSAADRLQVLLEEGELRRVALLRENVVHSDSEEVGARILADEQITGDHTGFVATTRALLGVLEESTPSALAYSSQPRARHSTSMAIAVPHSAQGASKSTRAVGSAAVRHLAGPDVLGVGV